MKKTIYLLLILIMSSCSVNERILNLENKLYSLNDSINILNAKLKIVQKPGDYFTGKNVTYVGIDAGKNNKASENVFIGNQSGKNSTDRNSVFVGYYSGSNSNGYGNVVIGNYSGGNIQGDNNIIIGKGTGNGELGEKNIIIGTHAGRNKDYSNKLIIDSQESRTPLIFGDFKTQKLKINGHLSVKGALNLTPSTLDSISKTEGTLYYDINTKMIKLWNGDEWINLNE